MTDLVDAYQGDSEMITVEVYFNATTLHWEFSACGPRPITGSNTAVTSLG